MRNKYRKEKQLKRSVGKVDNTFIISLAVLGTTCMISTALVRSTTSEASLAFSVYLSISRRRSWYFIIRCTGFINRSGSCSLCPSFWRTSWAEKAINLTCLALIHSHTDLPRRKCRDTPRQCAQIVVYFDNTPRTCWAVFHTCGRWDPVVPVELHSSRSQQGNGWKDDLQCFWHDKMYGQLTLYGTRRWFRYYQR